MCQLDAVVFDYGDTLMQYTYDRPTHVRSLDRLLEHLGVRDVGGERLLAEVDRLFPPALEARGEEGEMDYASLVREALAALGLGADWPQLVEAMRAGHREWDANVTLHEDSIELLRGVR